MALVMLALSLPSPALARDLSAECRRLAGSINEPDNPAKIGVAFEDIDTRRAIRVCQEAYNVEPWNAAIAFRLSRAYAAYGPEQNIHRALHLQRHVWGGAKRLIDHIGPDGVAWYKAYGKNKLTFETYRKAALGGDVLSQMSLAYLHTSENLNAERRKPDFAEAIIWMRMAAEQGFAPAQAGLGGLLAHERQYEEAFDWYMKASKQGFPPAHLWAGLAYFHGEGVRADKKLGFDYMTRAANAGVVEAQVRLAKIILDGKGVDANATLAQKWYQMAADAGDPIAKEMVEKLEKEKRADDALLIAGLLAAGFIMLIPGNDARTPPPADDGKFWLEEYEEQRKANLNAACPMLTPDQAMASGCGW